MVESTFSPQTISRFLKTEISTLHKAFAIQLALSLFLNAIKVLRKNSVGGDFCFVFKYLNFSASHLASSKDWCLDQSVQSDYVNALPMISLQETAVTGSHYFE